LFCFIEKTAKHACAIFIKLFQQSVQAPYERHTTRTKNDEETLESRPCVAYFPSECICYFVERLNFYMDRPDLLLLFLRLIERISGYRTIAEMLAEQSVLVLVVSSMKAYHDNARIQLSCLKTIDNLKSVFSQGLC